MNVLSHPIIAEDPIDAAGEFSDLELELKSVQAALDQADLDATAETRKSDAAIYYLYSRVAADRGPFTIADPETANTVILAMMRHANLIAAGAATAEELETAQAS
jgi:multidrug resistance efflux pump